jgi:hypothetical protein
MVPAGGTQTTPTESTGTTGSGSSSAGGAAGGTDTGVTNGGGGTTGSTQQPKPIQVVSYSGKYLPVDQLIVESEQGCDGGQAHWHAHDGVVVATDGSQVFDPGPQCGFGKVSDVPAMSYTPQ